MAKSPATAKRGRKPRGGAPAAPITVLPDPPDYLKDAGKEYWNRIGPMLVQTGILTSGHIESFALLCETWDEYRRISNWLSEDPERAVITYPTGAQAPAPQVQMRDRAAKLLYSLWSKFGLTPHALATLGKHGGAKIGSSKPSIKDFARKKYEE